MRTTVKVSFLVSGMFLAVLQTPGARLRLGDDVLWSSATLVGLGLIVCSLLLMLIGQMLKLRGVRPPLLGLLASGSLITIIGGLLHWLIADSVVVDHTYLSPRLVGVLLLYVGFCMSSWATDTEEPDETC